MNLAMGTPPAGAHDAGEGASDEEKEIRVLIVEDEAPLRKLLRRQLEAQGYEVWEAANGKTALLLMTRRPDLVILDLGLPDVDGVQVLRQMRQEHGDFPIIVLSARGDETSKVDALDLGADDYLAKPFGMEELFARLRAARRHHGQTQAERPTITVGELTVDLEKRTVKVRGKHVRLSRKEFQLLCGLVQHAGKPLSHSFLLREYWGKETDPQLLRVFIRALRQKIETEPERPSYILTERGYGYRFRAVDAR